MNVRRWEIYFVTFSDGIWYTDADVGIDVAFGRLFYETFALSYKHFQFPMDLAVLAFPCNQFGHQENATNQVARNILKRRWTRWQEYSKKEMKDLNLHPGNLKAV